MTSDDHMQEEKKDLPTFRGHMYKLKYIRMAKREAFWHMDVKNAGLCKSVLPCFRPMFQGTSPYDMAKHMVLKYQPFWDPEDLPFFKT